MLAEQHFTCRFVSVFFQTQQSASWTKQFTGIELSTDLQSKRIASDDLTLTVRVSVVSNYNKCTLSYISLNYPSYLYHPQTVLTLLHCSAAVFSKFHLLTSEVPYYVIQADAPIFLKATGNSMSIRSVKPGPGISHLYKTV